MEYNSVRVAIFHQIQKFLTDEQKAFFPFALDIVCTFVMNSAENFSGSQDAIRKQIVEIEVRIRS